MGAVKREPEREAAAHVDERDQQRDAYDGYLQREERQQCRTRDNERKYAQ